MAIDYQAIRADSERDYGLKFANVGRLLTDLYADRTHFLFELLQNAEDALRRRSADGPRSVTFEISEDSLRVRHYGEPFNEKDVRSICGIAESTKQEDKTAIGRFGIGFKSVYAWTDRPEIHSAGEHFAIETWVHPTPTAEIVSEPDETVIIIPFKDEMAGSRGEIVDALQSDSGSALLFLREIEEIAWSADGESSGHYLRERKSLDNGVHVVTIIGEDDSAETESWLVFSEPVEHDGTRVGHVEIAFRHVAASGDDPARIEPVSSSLLSAYFPTALETHLGFLMQGPYRTTPPRNDVPPNDEWNIGLVAQTAALLERTLPWLRDHGYLTPAGLECLPIDEQRFTRRSAPIGSPKEPTRFYPLFQAVKDALNENALLPAFSSGHVRPEQGLLGGTEALRKLFSAEQLRALFQAETDVVWLDPEITPNRTHALHAYLRSELNVREAGTEAIVRRLDKAFLEAQPDEWIRDLYEFLDDQRGIHNQDWFKELPLLRLEDRTHVVLRVGGRLGAYLPTPSRTGYPTLPEAVCSTDKALSFLRSVGLRNPDLVDDVLENVLPTYSADSTIDEQRYGSDLARMTEAFHTASEARRGILLAALRKTPFVRVVSATGDERGFARPVETYAPAERLRGLFRDLEDVSFVDESCSPLQSDDVCKLLAVCGIAERMRVVETTVDVDGEDERWVKVRKEAGWPGSTGRDLLTSRSVDRLDEVLTLISSIDVAQQDELTQLLWDELRDLTARYGDGLFVGQYAWFHYVERQSNVESRVVAQLNETAWIPVGGGALKKPLEVTLESLGWPRDETLERHVPFKAPADDQAVARLAEEADVSIEALEWARKLERLDVPTEELERLLAKYESGAAQGQSEAEAGGETGAQQRNGSSTREAQTEPERQTPARTGGLRREFRSYVAAERTREIADGGVEQEKRMQLEELAIQHIEAHESEWTRTEQNNPGFDLYQTNADGETVKWCEVKSLSGAWGEHPVGLSYTQFELAQEKGDAYWLYVVEHADDPKQIQFFRIPDPAGKARTFTFDQGWAEVAVADGDAGRADL